MVSHRLRGTQKITSLSVVIIKLFGSMLQMRKERERLKGEEQMQSDTRGNEGHTQEEEE